MLPLVSLVLIGAALLAPATARAADVIITNYQTNIFGVPWAVGLEKGIFAQVGAPVTGVTGGGGGGSVVRNLLVNDLPFGEVATTAAMAAQREGLPLIIVCGAAHTFGDEWVTMPKSSIHTVQDFVGKRIAYTSPQSISEANLMMLLNRNGIDPASIKKVAAGGYAQSLTLLEGGAVDVGMMGMPLSIIKKGKYRELFTVQEMLPTYLPNVNVTTRDFAEKNPGIIRAILEGRRRSVAYVYEHPDESAAIMAKTFNMNPQVALEAVRLAVASKVRVWPEGEIDIAEMRTLQEALRLTGAPVGNVDWSKLIDISYLPSDLQAKSRLDQH
jgi:NitT/TauT family transport system substrate-binding protein